MGRLRIAATVVLVAGSLLPALMSGRAFDGQSQTKVAALDASRSMPDVNPDIAKLEYASAAWYSVVAFQARDQKDAAAKARSEASFKALQAGPAWKAALEEQSRVGEVLTRRDAIRFGRLRVLTSVLLIATSLVLVAGLTRLRHGKTRTGAALFVGALAFAPLAIPSFHNSSFRLPVATPFLGLSTPTYAGWSLPAQAPAGEIWTPALAEAARSKVNYRFTEFPYANEDPSVLREIMTVRLLWARIVACLAILSTFVLRKLPRLDRLSTWSPSFRRHFPTFWPNRSQAELA
jgi:hypothetical protein